MIINNVKLKNWKCHLETELKFKKDVNVLFGKSGSGKSSVAEAICFGLFGTTPDLYEKRITVNDLITNDKKTAKVEIHFQSDGKKYSVKRRIERRKGVTYSEFVKNGKIIETDPRNVTQLIEKELGINYKLFRLMFTDYKHPFLLIPKGERMKKVDEFLSARSVEERERLTKTMNKLIKRKFGLETVIDLAKPNGLDELEKLKKDVEELSKKLQDAIEEEHNLEVKIRKQKTPDKMARLKDLTRKKAYFKVLIMEKKLRIDAYEQVSNETRATRKAIEKIKRKIEKHKTLLNNLEKKQAKVRGKFVRNLNHILNKLWRVLYPYEDFPEIELQIHGDDYLLMAKRKDRWIDFESIASGGERAIASLASRVSLVLALAPQLKFLILDEPTLNLDRRSLEALVHSLKELEKFFDQIVVFTHEEKLKDIAIGKVYELTTRSKLKT